MKAPPRMSTTTIRRRPRKTGPFFGEESPGPWPELVETSFMFGCSAQNGERQTSCCGRPQARGPLTSAFQPAVNDREYTRHKEKCGKGGEQQAANEGPAE